MADIFCEVLILIISWLTWQSRKFLSIKVNAYDDIIIVCEWIDDGHGQKYRGSVVNCSRC